MASVKTQVCDMPPYTVARRDYLSGMSFRSIGRKYNVSARSLYAYMQRRARSVGDPWPLRDSEDRSIEAHNAAWGSVPALGVRLELLELERWSGLNYEAIAELAGFHKTTVNKIMLGRRRTIACDTRDRLMELVYAQEASRDRAVAS